MHNPSITQLLDVMTRQRQMLFILPSLLVRRVFRRCLNVMRPIRAIIINFAPGIVAGGIATTTTIELVAAHPPVHSCPEGLLANDRACVRACVWCVCVCVRACVCVCVPGRERLWYVFVACRGPWSVRDTYL